jgi:hypothetical protein
MFIEMIAPDRNTDPGRVEWLPGINAAEYCGGKLFPGAFRLSMVLDCSKVSGDGGWGW